MMRLLYRMLLPISNQYFMQQGGGCLKGKNFNNMTAFLLKSPLYKRNCSKLKNIIAFLRGSSETINGYIFTSHHCLGSCKKWVKESTMWGQRRKRIKANDKFSWFRKDTLFRLSNLLYSLFLHVLKVFQKLTLWWKVPFYFSAHLLFFSGGGGEDIESILVS